MALNPAHKGKSGEVEMCKWVFKNLGADLHLTEIPERNYNQSQGGADVIIPNFIIEVKRREILDLQSWWHQVTIAKKHNKNQDLVPVVAYRQNRKAWQFLLPASLIGIDKGYIILSELVFTKLARRVIKGLPITSV